MNSIKIFLGMVVIAVAVAASFQKKDITVSGQITDKITGEGIPAAAILVKGTKVGTAADLKGNYTLKIPSETSVLVISAVGYRSQEVKVGAKRKINVSIEADNSELEEIVVLSSKGRHKKNYRADEADYYEPGKVNYSAGFKSKEDYQNFNTEEYSTIHENAFLEAVKNPLSTFSVDVDAASYANMRRFINSGTQPPKDAVRIEEMINYFNYDYPQPKEDMPFSVNTEISDCPWNAEHKLVHIGLQGRKIPTKDLPPSNLVFLIDVSGSMDSPNKLPLLKTAFRMLTDQLREEDHVAIVVYAGAAGQVLPSTSGEDRQKIIGALNNLNAGGSTAGGAGINLAYKIAKENFVKGGNNRIILATDGDFNIGASSNADMERLIEKKREEGVFLTVLGFGMGNYKDSKMETIADKGNGNYAYIDNISEAKKVLVNEFGGTLFTIAKDVKLQIEFNPAKVKGYRLIGYENRMLNKEDFNNDKKDAGDIGSGHTVTALYEIVPAGSTSDVFNKTDDLKYQKTEVDPKAYSSKELMTVKLRYKAPDGNKSKLIEHPLADKSIALKNTSDNFRFSAAVAAFGMLLRDSEFKGTVNHENVIELASSAYGKDKNGYRREFVKLVEASTFLSARE